MKARLITAIAFVSVTANAEVITCPPFYPTKSVPLSEISPGGSDGYGRVTGARLSSASMNFGKLYGDGELHGDMRNVKGGRDIRFGFEAGQSKWLVCVYGGSERVGGTIEWWAKVDSKVTSCELKIRESKVPHTASDWTATATCM